MCKKIISLAFIFCLCFNTPSALSQSVFDIEFVFFKRIDQQDNSAQVKESELPTLETEFSFEALPEGFSLLTTSELKMHGIWDRLKTSKSIRPLLHIGWRQPLMDKSQTPWLSYSANDAPEEAGLDEFNGIIRFSRNQGLLVEHQVIGFKPLNMPQELNTIESFESDDSPIDDIESYSLDNNQSPVIDMQMPEQLHGYFVLSEYRKVKLEELHYFDHPNMGILLKVTPYKASLEEQEALQNP